MNSNIVSFKNVQYQIKKVPILNHVSFDIPKQSICALVGKNGAGKTTLIKCMLNLITTYNGQILINGVDSKKVESHDRIGYIPEKDDFWGISILDFLLEQAKYKNVPKKEALPRIKYLCGKMGFPFAKTKFQMKSLSSGLKKIIMIIQAFVAPYDIIIADEPTANLDFETRMNFYRLVEEENKNGKTFLISTHDLLEVKHFANHYVHIRHGKLLKITKSFNFDPSKQDFKQ